jgi:uncharacterized protein YbjT (DUF2867 family)
MKFLVIGGTGLIGSKVVSHLRNNGHEVVVGAPSEGIDIIAGTGLDAAMKGANVVVDISNSPSFDDAAVLEFFQTGTGNLLAAGARAGVSHHVALSVVGTQKLGESGYFRGKMAQESLIRASGIPYTIVHSTQFFEFLPAIVKFSTYGNEVRLPPVLFQPIASADVAEAVARHAMQAPVGGITEICGPERNSMPNFVQRYLRAQQDSRPVVSDENARYYGVQVQMDTLVPESAAWQGSTSFEQWLERSGAAHMLARA